MEWIKELLAKKGDEFIETGRKIGDFGDGTLSFFENLKISIRIEKPIGKVLGQSNDYTCVPNSLRMVLEDFGIIRSEEYLSTLLATTIDGTILLDIPKYLKNDYLDDLLLIARGGTKDKNVKFSTLEKLLKNGDKKAIVSIADEKLGAHAVVVDKIVNGRVFVRDPLPLYQGSSYSVSIEDFEAVFNSKFITIKNRKI